MLFEVWGLWAEETSAGLHVTPDSWTGQTHELHKELNPEPYIQRGNGAVKCSYAGRVGHRVNEVIVEVFPFSSTTPLPFPCLGPDHLNTTDRGGGGILKITRGKTWADTRAPAGGAALSLKGEFGR